MGAFQQLQDALEVAEAAELRFTPASRWSLIGLLQRPGLNGAAVVLRRLQRNGRAEVQLSHGGMLSVRTACLAPPVAFARTFATGSAAASSSATGQAAEPGEREGEDLSLLVDGSFRVELSSLAKISLVDCASLVDLSVCWLIAEFVGGSHLVGGS